MKPTVIGIGAQKCATSWLHAAMGAHPDVAVSDPKEVDFLSYHFDRGFRWYEAHWAGASAPARFEASPSYLHDPRAPARAAAYDGALKAILCLRDPVERAFSNHLHEVVKGHIPAIPFAEGLANNPSYVEQGLYAQHLRRWLDHLGRDRVLVLLAEDIKADPVAAARRAYAFAGVDAAFASPVLAERRNESDRARIPLLRRALRAGGDALRRAGAEGALARLKATGPVSRVMRANSVDLRAVVPPMDEGSRARLLDLFAPDLRALPAMLGRRDLPWASWRAVAGLRDDAA